jgi:hypothetical protein
VFAYLLGTKQDTDITLLRGIGAPFSFEAEGNVVNQIRIKVTNRGSAERSYRIVLAGAEGARLVLPENPFLVAAGASRTESAFIILPPTAFTDGQRPVRFEITDGDRFTGAYPYLLVGPESPEEPSEPDEAGAPR